MSDLRDALACTSDGYVGCSDGWQEVVDRPTATSALGVHWIEVELGDTAGTVEFTWQHNDGVWHGRNYVIAVSATPGDNAATAKADRYPPPTSSATAGQKTGA